MSRKRASRLKRWYAPTLLGAGLALGAAAPSASAPPSGSASSSSSLPTIAGANIPTEPSSPPKAAEWKAALQVRVSRGDQGRCSASLLREWLRLRCPGWIGGGLVAGDPKGVTISAFSDTSQSESSDTSGGLNAVTSLVLPLRRGQAKVVSFLQFAEEYNSLAAAEAGVLSVVWRAGRADPVLVMTRRAAPSMF